jgi:hypothetical protein
MDQACLGGVALHSFQNGMVSVRVPGVTAPHALLVQSAPAPRDPPQGRALSNWHGESEVEPTEWP